jgi:hypothetical protein
VSTFLDFFLLFFSGIFFHRPDVAFSFLFPRITGIIDSGPWINGCSGWNGRNFHEPDVRRLLSKMVPSGVPGAGGHVRYAHTEAKRAAEIELI